ncbi:MAG: hydroxymethylglutaryl-CoA synthase family protein [Deltaproteobacteria bacterium]|nr:MAG: hydroxymethylglutaryl-CoA synthase family protein [Deltaproteobacteria bacterium]
MSVTLATRQRVGIEKIWAYPGQTALDMTELADARDREHSYVLETLLVKERSVNPCWEDPVTIAVNAAKPMLSEEDRQSIEFLLVGTESSPDQGKPISTFVHRFLDLPPTCRNFETKHACYSGTSALMTAVHWVASGVAGDAKALVIATDQSRMHLGSPWEFVMGTGAVALLISNKPKVIEFELETNGYWTKEVGDTFRPTSKIEAGNTENSVYCYLEALEGAYDHFLAKAGDTDMNTDFKAHLYHVPFGGMVFRAHRTLLRRTRPVKKKEAQANFDAKVLPGLSHNSRFGGTYSASTFLALMGMVDNNPDLEAGDHLSIFSYGSGSCSEFYRVHLCPEAKDVVAQANLGGLLDNRQKISVAEYEAIENERTGYIDVGTYVPPTDGINNLYKNQYEGKNLLVLKNLDGFFRNYDWS